MTVPVSYIPDVFPDSGMVDELWAALPWENREGAPRYEAWMNDYDLPYTYGHGEHARTYQAMPRWNVTVDFIRRVLNARGHSFDCCFVNGYAHGRQHLGWHADDSPEMDLDHAIAVVSFGAERDIWFRPKEQHPNLDPYKQLLCNGSLLVMHAGMQRSWQHRIPKSPDANCGKRVSLTFRRLVR